MTRLTFDEEASIDRLKFIASEGCDELPQAMAKAIVARIALLEALAEAAETFEVAWVSQDKEWRKTVDPVCKAVAALYRGPHKEPTA
jgi:hypothetical protein